MDPILIGYGAGGVFNFHKCTLVNHAHMVGELEQALFLPLNAR
jgi:hypothetical protein